MSPEISERSFEEAIEQALLTGGPDAYPRRENVVAEPEPPSYGDYAPGGYRRRKPEDYDRTLCLLPREVQQNIDMESYRIQETRCDRSFLSRGRRSVRSPADALIQGQRPSSENGMMPVGHRAPI